MKPDLATDGHTTYDLIVANGLIVNAGGSRQGSVLVKDGRVVDVIGADQPLPPARRIVDATGILVLPGGVDPHCHVGQVLGEFSMLDDHEQAGIAALWGGTTTIIDFAIPDPGQAPLEALHEKLKLLDRCRTDVAIHGAVINWDSTTKAQLKAMAELGVLTVKMFTTYRDGVMASFETIENVMRELETLGGMAIIHAEENHLIEDTQEKAVREGREHARFHPESRPEAAEAAAVVRSLELAEKTGASVYFVHQTTPEAVDLVADARSRGVRAYSETCPHYLTLDDTVYEGEHPELFVCCPPLRSADTVKNLRALVGDGLVHTIGSDHCCYSREQKAKHSHDMRSMPNGLPGAESRLTVSFDTLVVQQGMSVESFVALFSTNPARLNGLSAKGWIGPGSDADIVVFDPGLTKAITAAGHHMNSDYSPYEGMTFTGWPTAVISKGNVVVDSDGFHDPGPVGRFLHARARIDSDPALPPQAAAGLWARDAPSTTDYATKEVLT
ncbi:D-hydantoinase [Arthrobacter sp. Bi83]|uniref:amidohydrolase family protein n=1 Tax=Arthrobacter sp. Bi83 TaxID=2822353 RepID=UPI001D6ED464|nr:amidohydrolase family protein [Arthrobacter sp. Bi83]CAH0125308.1 D-hydantoinase [Arthrobacter sp. Bi83]